MSIGLEVFIFFVVIVVDILVLVFFKRVKERRGYLVVGKCER